MSDLRRRFGDPDLTGVEPPGLDKLRRRVRHRRWTVSGAGVTALTGALAIPLALTQLPTGGTQAASPQEDTALPSAVSYQMYDRSHAIRIEETSRRTEGSGNPDGCPTLAIQVTSDGGATWSPPRVPGDLECRVPSVTSTPREAAPTSGGFAPTARLLDIDTIVVAAGEQHVISQDAGVAWQEYVPEIVTVDQLPETGVVTRFCEELSPLLECGGPRARWGIIDPGTGNVQVLAGWTEPRVWDVTEAADGSLWVVTTTSAGGTEVRVSHDRGATWRTGDLPEIRGDSHPAVDVSSHDGETGYVASSGWTAPEGERERSTPAGEPGPLVLYRTTDGGRTWDLVMREELLEHSASDGSTDASDTPPSPPGNTNPSDTPPSPPGNTNPSDTPPSPPGNLAGSPPDAPRSLAVARIVNQPLVATPDGTLLLCWTNGWWSSRDGGETFTPADEFDGPAMIQPSGGTGFWVQEWTTDTAGDGSLWFSEDGLEWTEIQTPE